MALLLAADTFQCLRNSRGFPELSIQFLPPNHCSFPETTLFFWGPFPGLWETHTNKQRKASEQTQNSPSFSKHPAATSPSPELHLLPLLAPGQGDSSAREVSCTVFPGRLKDLTVCVGTKFQRHQLTPGMSLTIKIPSVFKYYGVANSKNYFVFEYVLAVVSL